ncbi:MAG: polyphosphate--nucleotide phosphotransferase [Bacteroidetes bacterium HGW-Bacteroidetes-6]|jgi:PPK2 family polyphosphate:nucleotide phosphotransferase|nr:MAG: polyphosphate--nucleotide phosphotransferase [Bacteroidetes bacterium HGW-Bacteroidetes-6]
MKLSKLIAEPGTKISLNDFKTDYTGDLNKEEAKELLKKNIAELSVLQDVFWADNRYSLLIILQAPDAAGKDGVVKHVMSGLNPQGCVVSSFKTPSSLELDHNYLWRHYLALPERGQIGVFNRSHYENVLVTKVHPQYILNERLPGYDSVEKFDKKFWEDRYEQINNFEKGLRQNGTIVLKFFLHLSKDEQKKRLLERIDRPEKNWKFSPADLAERAYWKEYQQAYEEMLTETSTKFAPWYVIPADHKWFTRIAIGEIIAETLKNLDLHYPAAASAEVLEKAKKQLEGE